MSSRFSVATPWLTDRSATLSAEQLKFNNAGEGSEFGSDALRPLGFEVGEWPRELFVTDLRMEPLTRFTYLDHSVRDGDLQFVRWQSEAGDVVTLFND